MAGLFLPELDSGSSLSIVSRVLQHTTAGCRGERGVASEYSWMVGKFSEMSSELRVIRLFCHWTSTSMYRLLGERRNWFKSVSFYSYDLHFPLGTDHSSAPCCSSCVPGHSVATDWQLRVVATRSFPPLVATSQCNSLQYTFSSSVLRAACGDISMQLIAVHPFPSVFRQRPRCLKSLFRTVGWYCDKV